MEILLIHILISIELAGSASPYILCNFAKTVDYLLVILLNRTLSDPCFFAGFWQSTLLLALVPQELPTSTVRDRSTRADIRYAQVILSGNRCLSAASLLVPAQRYHDWHRLY